MRPILPPPEEDAALVERRNALVREWSGLRSDAPVPRPEGMEWEEYFAKYKVVNADGNKVVVALTGPPEVPAPSTAEAAEIDRREEVIRKWVRQAIADGYPPPPESKVWQLFTDEKSCRP